MRALLSPAELVRLVVACQYGRSFIGIELSPVYAEMAERRIHNEGGLFSVQP